MADIGQRGFQTRHAMPIPRIVHRDLKPDLWKQVETAGVVCWYWTAVR